MALYENTITYSVDNQKEYFSIINKISTLETKISNTKAEYYTTVYAYLESVGMEIVDNSNTAQSSEDIHLSATDAGKMQTTSSVSYNASTGEFYYFVEYDYNGTNLLGAYVGLNDTWGDYDLVSMQHKGNTAWYWNNIIVTANLTSGFYGNSMVGKADKYQILDSGLFNTSAVSNRESLWNGCIFNVKDDEVTGTGNFSGHIRYVTVEGWLKSTGSGTSSQVKSEYEHNYAKWALSSVSISATGLNDTDFTLSVTYNQESGAWRRSAGSRVCTVN